MKVNCDNFPEKLCEISNTLLCRVHYALLSLSLSSLTFLRLTTILLPYCKGQKKS